MLDLPSPIRRATAAPLICALLITPILGGCVLPEMLRRPSADIAAAAPADTTADTTVRSALAAPAPMPPAPPVVVHTGTVAAAPYGEVPVAANLPGSEQTKLQATQHWMRIADDAAQSTLALIKAGNLCAGATTTGARGKPAAPVPLNKCPLLSVKTPTPQTEFSRAFRNQLITRLVRLGLPVSTGNDGALTTEIDIQPIVFAANRPQYRYAGVPVELGPGVWAIRDVMDAAAGNPAVAPPAPDALHWFRSEFAAGQTPRTELYITVSLSDKRRYIARSANAYYITDADKHLYDRELCTLFDLCARTPAEFAAAAKKAAPRGPAVRTLEITGGPAAGSATTRRATPARPTVAPLPATPAPADAPAGAAAGTQS